MHSLCTLITMYIFIGEKLNIIILLLAMYNVFMQTHIVGWGGEAR